ncbi:MAG TPA: fibronectin type III domain-containing protein [Jatrophihabitans sp.]|nr:fibronectin type III domain-containing protein [Jatrophihabitans sp.]
MTASAHTDTPRPRRSWRAAAVLPAVAATVLGLCGLVLTGAPSASAAPSSRGDGSPVGAVVRTQQVPGGLRVVGWDFDYDAPRTPLRTFARVDAKPGGSVIAADERASVAKQHPRAGSNHGFDFVVPVPEGKHTVCIRAHNLDKGKSARLECVTHTFDYGPYGHVDTVEAVPGALHVAGWTIDADAPKHPVTVSVSVDGTSHVVTADAPRADVAKTHKVAGPDHGFDTTIPVAQGPHQVCVTAFNIGPYGTDNPLGCAKATVNDNPVGGVDFIQRAGTKLEVRGWTFDPDQPTRKLRVAVRVDGKWTTNLVADRKRRDVAAAHPDAGPDHGFYAKLAVAEGVHHVCLVARNVSYGTDLALSCQDVTVRYTPTATLTELAPSDTGVVVSGWASDPETTNPIKVQITVDGRQVTTVTANGNDDADHPGHSFNVALPLKSGAHNVCAIGVNVGYGTKNSPPSCSKITLALSPLGLFNKLHRAGSSSDLALRGWALDPDAGTGAISVAVTVDGAAPVNLTANAPRPNLGKHYPWLGANHGFQDTLSADAGEHTVCVTARNIRGGTDGSLGCLVINAVNPVAPTAPQNVKAQVSGTTATITWQPPASDGGAPPSSYVVTAKPGGTTVKTAGNVTKASVPGLQSNKAYTFSVVAVNVAGTSPAGVSNQVTTQTGPPPQRTPAPVSTSRYIRNVSGASAADLRTMRAEGRADALANPSGHRYLILLDIGGQDQYDGGVVLSATTRFVSYGDLARDVQAYTDGYHSGQRPNAPVVIAIGTNNDMDVSAASGKTWAQRVVNPVRSHAAGYAGMVIAGANDIEPGFRANYRQSASWLNGYLAGTRAPFVFNGSADGCSWTTPNRGCNNGWTMSGLYHLATGAAPSRMTNLPQIYNTTMAAQWKYISLTGIGQGLPRIRFGGTLTEWTACDQSGGCGSLTGHSAWRVMWRNLQSDARLKVRSLPYSTDLRIDR